MNSRFFLSFPALLILGSATFIGLNHRTGSPHGQGALLLPIDKGAFGPESFAFDPSGGGPYTGLSDGRIVKWLANESRWSDFAFTSPERQRCDDTKRDPWLTEDICGRPLGLCFNLTSGDLYIADAYMGLLVVGPGGGLPAVIANEIDGSTLLLPNSLEVESKSVVVYFTDSSTRYRRRDYMAAMLSGDRTGRLLKYERDGNNRAVMTVLLEGIGFANGVAFSEDGDYLLVVETTACRILRYWLKPPKAGNVEVFAQLAGFPDNIKRSPRGGYWVGMFTRRTWLLRWILSDPRIGRALLEILPMDVIRKVEAAYTRWRGRGVAVRLSEEGGVAETLDKAVVGMTWESISEVEERDGVLWIGSVTMPFAGVYNIT
ncbi:hypothetical protein MLD38_004483 [Melastoma candidum]|uniref:Uncharacterized protein n=1 Tax=Melastoma candidum TaxID=119954 RepID=A0ACB9SED6_9MYRT|nr:hypothetical protein MLD38_004483 [Melastoma candidum]